MYDYAELLRRLEHACGYWQNGSQETVKITQDDATTTWTVSVGNTTYDGDSFADALNKLPEVSFD